MHSFFSLLSFEFKKLMHTKKTFMYFAVFNLVALIMTITTFFLAIKQQQLLQFSQAAESFKIALQVHFWVFIGISPFLLSMLVGNSFSTEFNKGYMKMLVLTPLRRWEIITAKIIILMLFAISAVLLGVLLLQVDFMLVSYIAKSSEIFLINFSALSQIFFMIFVCTLNLICFFTLWSMFFESTVSLAFFSVGLLMVTEFIHFLMNNLLFIYYPWMKKASEFCFTDNFITIYTPKNISDIISGSEIAFNGPIMDNCLILSAWTAVFFILSVLIFSRKKILH